MPKLFSQIAAISYVLPNQVYSNKDYFADFPNLKNDSNLDKIGIESRHIVDKETTASDLAVEAAKKLFLENPGVQEQVDFIVFCAQEQDHYTPATSCVIHQRLEFDEHVGTLDIAHGCSGFTYGLSLAKAMIETHHLNAVLLLTSSTLTKKIHKKDKSSRFIFGDAAAATLITASDDKEGIKKFVFGTKGKDYNKIIVEDGFARQPLRKDSSIEIEDEFGNIRSKNSFFMDGMGVFYFTIATIPKLVNDILTKNNLHLNQIDFFIFHQANAYINKLLCKKMGIPEEKFIIDMKDIGNTVSSSIPIALQRAMQSNRIKKNQTVLLAGFGTGLSWSGTVIKV